jgi:hypothetical protein
MSMAQQSAAHPTRVEASYSSLSPARRTDRASSGPGGGCDFQRARPGVATCTSSQCQLPIRLRQRVQLWSGDDTIIVRQHKPSRKYGGKKVATATPTHDSAGRGSESCLVDDHRTSTQAGSRPPRRWSLLRLAASTCVPCGRVRLRWPRT